MLVEQIRYMSEGDSSLMRRTVHTSDFLVCNASIKCDEILPDMGR